MFIDGVAMQQKEMNENKRYKKWLILLGVIVTFVVHAAIPASTAYLDKKMAVIQAEINEVHLKLFGN